MNLGLANKTAVVTGAVPASARKSQNHWHRKAVRFSSTIWSGMRKFMAGSKLTTQRQVTETRLCGCRQRSNRTAKQPECMRPT